MDGRQRTTSDQIILTLKKQGLTQKEAIIYLSSLQVPSGSASTIARKAGEKRLTTYNALQSLLQKGIASSYDHNGTMHYSVISPEALFEKKKNQTEKELSGLQQLIPQLKELAQQDIMQTSVKYVQGLEGLKTLHEDMLNSPYLYNLIAAGGKIDEDFLNYIYKEHIPQRIKIGTDVKIMLTNTAYARYIEHHESIGHSCDPKKTKKIDKPSRECEHDLILYGDHNVAMINSASGQLSGLVFSHPSFYHLCKSMMDLVWEVL